MTDTPLPDQFRALVNQSIDELQTAPEIYAKALVELDRLKGTLDAGDLSWGVLDSFYKALLKDYPEFLTYRRMSPGRHPITQMLVEQIKNHSIHLVPPRPRS